MGSIGNSMLTLGGLIGKGPFSTGEDYHAPKPPTIPDKEAEDRLRAKGAEMEAEKRKKARLQRLQAQVGGALVGPENQGRVRVLGN